MSTTYSGPPSQSIVVVPDPPAWLNIDEILSYDEREWFKDVVETGRELLPVAAEFGRMVKEAMALIDALPASRPRQASPRGPSE